MKLICAVIASVTLAAPAVASGWTLSRAAKVPTWAYWTPKQAGKNVIRANPQRIDYKGHDTTITDAACKGTKAAKAGRYRSFSCAVHYRDDTLNCCSLATTLYITTSTVKRNAVACWSRSQAALARGECRPPKIGG